MPSNITRRAALGAIASVSATGAAGAALAASDALTHAETPSLALAGPEAGETPAEKLDRLAEEMAVTLDEWLDGWASTQPGARRPLWHARVWPASSDHGHVLINDRALERADVPETDAELLRLGDELETAFQRMEEAGTAVRGEEQEKVYLARMDECDAVMHQIFRLPATTPEGRAVKLKAVEIGVLDFLPDDLTGAGVRSILADYAGGAS